MKKGILITLIVLVTNVYNLNSKEIPINGTDNLVTYTVKGSNLVGVKEKGVQGKVIIYPAFVSVEAYGGFLFGKIPNSPDTYGIYHLNGKSTADINKAKIVKKTENYRIVQFTRGSKRIISPIRPANMGIGEDAYISGDIIFGKVSEKWNIMGVSATGYDKIIVAKSNGKLCYIVQEKRPTMTNFYIWIQETPDKAKLLQCYYAPKLRKIVEEIEANLPPAYEQNTDGIIKFYNLDVTKYISSLIK